MTRDESVRLWRASDCPGVLCMHGVTSSYVLDPVAECVFGVIVDGGMHARRGRQQYTFRAGDVCVWDPSARHTGAPHGGERWEARLMAVEMPDLMELLLDGEGGPWHAALREARVRDANLTTSFLRLHQALERPASALERETRLLEWLKRLAGEPQQGPANQRRARDSSALRRACELLMDEPEHNISLAQLAEVSGVSRHALARLFRDAYGVPPHRFQLARRLRLARTLLERRVPLADVAQRTGFTDQSHLHRHFRRSIGFTPAAYARLVRSNVQDVEPGPP